MIVPPCNSLRILAINPDTGIKEKDYSDFGVTLRNGLLYNYDVSSNTICKIYDMNSRCVWEGLLDRNIIKIPDLRNNNIFVASWGQVF